MAAADDAQEQKKPEEEAKSNSTGEQSTSKSAKQPDCPPNSDKTSSRDQSSSTNRSQPAPPDELPPNELPSDELPSDELPSDELPSDELPIVHGDPLHSSHSSIPDYSFGLEGEVAQPRETPGAQSGDQPSASPGDAPQLAAEPVPQSEATNSAPAPQVGPEPLPERSATGSGIADASLSDPLRTVHLSPDASSVAPNAAPIVETPAAPPALPSNIELVPIESALGAGWNLMTSRIGLLMAISTIAGLLICLPVVVNYIIPEIVKRNGFLSFCLGIFLPAVVLMYHIGRIKVTIGLIRGQAFDSDNFVTANTRIFHFMLLLLLKAIILWFSLCCFVLPFFIMHARLDFADYLVIDRRQNAFSAIGNSWNITKGATLMLIIFGVTCKFIEALGFLILFVGVVPAKWMTDFARAFIYNRLLNIADGTTSLKPGQEHTKIG